MRVIVARACHGALATLVALILLLPNVTPAASQPEVRIVDVDFNMVLASDGRVFVRRLGQTSYSTVNWDLLTRVPTDSRPVAIRHLIDIGMFFLVFYENGDVIRYDGVNRRLERLSNVFGVPSAPQVKPKTIPGR